MSFLITHILFPRQEKPPRNQEQDYEELLEKVTVGVFIIRENSFKYANHTFCRFLDYTLEELQDIDPLEIINPHDKRSLEEAIEFGPEETNSSSFNDVIMLNT